MVNKPKAIGTAAETAIVRWLQANGFPGAERRALRGNADAGDILVCPGVIAEVKAGKAAATASDHQVDQWLDETERERVNAGAEHALLVLRRTGVGPANAGRWWAVLDLRDTYDLINLTDDGFTATSVFPGEVTTRITLADAAQILRRAGYGDQDVQDGAA